MDNQLENNLEQDLNKTYNLELKGIDILILYTALQNGIKNRNSMNHPLTDNPKDQIETMEFDDDIKVNMMIVNVMRRMVLLRRALTSLEDQNAIFTNIPDDIIVTAVNDKSNYHTSDIKLLNDAEFKTVLDMYCRNRSLFEERSK